MIFIHLLVHDECLKASLFVYRKKHIIYYYKQHRVGYYYTLTTSSYNHVIVMHTNTIV